jgi:hypothetical protein
MRSILLCGLTTVAQPVVELILKRDVAENADLADVDRRIFSYLPVLSHALIISSSLEYSREIVTKILWLP